MLYLLLFLTSINALQFGYELQPDEYKCFSDSLPHKELYELNVLGSSAKYYLRIEYTEKLNKKIVYQRDHIVSHFFHDMIVDYHYTVSFCFKSMSREPLTLDINYLTGSEILDYEQIATIKNIDDFNVELTVLENENKDIIREKEYLLQQETYRFDSTHDISNKIISLGFFSIGIFFIVSYCNLYQIRKIFQRKKIQ